jgi:ribonuclease BN (tRNA processing enzyme)
MALLEKLFLVKYGIEPKEGEMKLYCLGTGVCVPRLGGGWPSGYAMTWDDRGKERRLMLECSEGMRYRMTNAGLSWEKFYELFISHNHHDHAAPGYHIQALAAWPYYERGATVPDIRIHAPQQVFDLLDTSIYGHLPQRQRDGQIEKLKWPQVTCCPLAGETVQWRIGNGKLSAYQVEHAANTQAYALRLELPEGVFVYSGDSKRCKGLIKAARGAKTFVCEAGVRTGEDELAQEFGHMTPHHAGMVAAEAKVDHLVLVHLPDRSHDHNVLAYCRQGGFEGQITIPNDGDIIEM